MNENKISYKNMYLFSAAIIGIMAALAAWAWMQLPAGQGIPVHWNAAGEADRFGSKFEGLILLPLITAGVTLLLAIVPRISPKGENIQRSGTAYMAVWGATLLLMLAIYVAGLADIFGWATNPMGKIAQTALAFFLIVMGNYMGKIRHNYMFGVRTPWTIASEQSWNKTHRITGRLWVVVGLLTLATAWFLSGSLSVYLLLIGMLGSTAFAMIYSYIVWKNDPTLQTQ